MKIYRKDQNIFHHPDTNMILSFGGLIKIVDDQLGARLDEGDIVVFDNHNQTRRKILMRIKNGYSIYYMWRTNKDMPFIPVGKKDPHVELEF